MRWIEEWREPELKCARVGHRLGIEYREGYRKPCFDVPSERNFIGLFVKHERVTCLRCRAEQGEWLEIDKDGFHQFTWPSEMADKFRRDGFVWKRSGLSAYHDIEVLR